MKILLIDKFHHVFGGAERAYFDTARVLQDDGHEVAFFSMHHSDNEDTKWSKYFVDNVDLRNDNQSVIQKIRIAIRMIWNRQAQKKLEDLLKEFKPDVVHMHLIYHQLSPSIIWTLHKHGIPMVMTLHDFKLVSPNYNMLVRGRIWDKKAWQCVGDRCVKDSTAKSMICVVEHYVHRLIGTWKKVDIFIAPSYFLAKKYAQKKFVKKIQHVAQPLRKSFFTPCTQVTDEKTQRPDDYILYFGRLSYEKGLPVLLKAFAKSKAKNLVFVGDGDEKDILKKIATELHIEDRVFFPGFQRGEALHAWICGARATVMASACYENMPYALLEALASGVIVIAADMGGMPERIEDGVNGFLYEPGNTQQLTQKINMTYDIDQKTLSQNAQDSTKDLQEERYLDNLLDVYKEAMENNDKQI